MNGQDYKKTWTQEEAEYVRKIGNMVKSKGLSIANELPRLFHEKFQTHTNEAVVTYWNTHYVQRQVQNAEEERKYRREEKWCLTEYKEAFRQAEERMKARQKKMRELREERLRKARASYGGYSVG